MSVTTPAPASALSLTQARRYAVTKNTRIEFRTSQGLDCVIDEHGIARVPGLNAAPGFTVTGEFAQAKEFHLVQGAQRRTVTCGQLLELAGASKPAADHHHDEDE